MKWIETATMLNCMTEEKLHEVSFLGYLDYGDGSFDYTLCCWSFYQHGLIKTPSADPVRPTHLILLNTP